MATYINVLEYVIKNKGYDDYIKDSLKKILEYERSAIIENIKVLDREIKDYEKKYAMSSEKFNEKFNKGLLDEKNDFIDWFALLDTKIRLEKTVRKLEGVN